MTKRGYARAAAVGAAALSALAIALVSCSGSFDGIKAKGQLPPPPPPPPESSPPSAQPPPPPPPPLAASDSFGRAVPAGWGAAGSGGWWTVVGSPWSWSVSSGTGAVAVSAGSREMAYLSQFTGRDTDIVETVALPACAGARLSCAAFVTGRYTAAYNPTYYRVGVASGAGSPDVFLRAQRSDGTELTAPVDTRLPVDTRVPVSVAAARGTVVHLHVQFTGVHPTTIRARAWLDGTPEPSVWLLSIADTSDRQQRTGMVGVEFQNDDTRASRQFRVTSYQVVGPGRTAGSATPASTAANPESSAHWLYVVDDGQINVYDIDHDHALVKQFALPEAGKRGVGVAPAQGILYVSECGLGPCGNTSGSLLAYDLVHDVVVWIARYPFGVDQFALTPDGLRIYMPHGEEASDGTHTILDATTGMPIGSIRTGTNGHNTVSALDGTQVYLGGRSGANDNYLHVVNPIINQVTLDAGPTLNGIRPFTVNARHTLAFTTSTGVCGFQVLSLTTGQVIATLPFRGSCPPTDTPSHGISLSPDEKRVYVIDSPLDALEVYDVSGLPAGPPAFVAAVPLTSLKGPERPCQTHCERTGWVLNDLSGRFVYVGDRGDVINASTLRVMKTLPALQNTRLMIEVDWAGGAPRSTSTRFGIGRMTR